MFTHRTAGQHHKTLYKSIISCATIAVIDLCPGSPLPHTTTAAKTLLYINTETYLYSYTGGYGALQSMSVNHTSSPLH